MNLGLLYCAKKKCEYILYRWVRVGLKESREEWRLGKSRRVSLHAIIADTDGVAHWIAQRSECNLIMNTVYDRARQMTRRKSAR
jgi:hypothetical protein